MKFVRIAQILLIFVTVVLFSGCSQRAGSVKNQKIVSDVSGSDDSAGTTSVADTKLEFVDQKISYEINPWKPSDKCVLKAEELLKQMTVAEKAGQMTQVAMRYLPLKDITDLAKYSIGSMLAGGTDFPGEDLSASAWAGYIDEVKAAAIKGRLHIPLIFGIDAVHGNGKSVGAVVFPHNIGLGCTGDTELIEEIGRITALETRGSGVDWAFSPVLAAARDERWGRTYEAFGETPDLAAAYGAALVKGLQGDVPFGKNSVLASIKHFAGDGDTVFGTSHMDDGFLDRGNVTLDMDTFYDLAIKQYIPSINAGAGSVMVSYSSYMGVKMHANRELITDVLKKELGFNGFVVSDWMGIDDIPGDFETDVAAAINAGIDMVMLPDRYKEFIKTVQSLVPAKISESRIDDSVKRILQVKCEMGMFEDDYSNKTDESLTKIVGSREHRLVGRKAVAESLVLLKNQNSLLPLNRDAKIFVTGSGADSLDKQCGGWTVNWDGNGSKTVGTTVVSALKKVSDNIYYSENPKKVYKKADVAVVVVGESQYAEWRGDRDNLHLDAEDIAAIDSVKKSGIPFVVVLFSGRPMIITDELEKADSWIAAWLPGTEGEGIADVLFGDVKPAGKLSHSWPKNMGQIPINYGDSNYTPLFPLGYGLTY